MTHLAMQDVDDAAVSVSDEEYGQLSG